MNILLSGSSGFVGASILKILSKKGHRVFCIDRGNLKRDLNIENIRYVTELELSQIEENIDVLIYAAWGGTRGIDRDDVEIQRENLNLINRVLLLAKKLKVKSVISFGSQAEYGHVNNLDSNPQIKTVSQYGIHKVLAKELIYKFCKENNMRFIWLRLFSIYGIEDYDSSLISVTIRRMLRNEQIDLTECVQFWDYLNINDLLNLIEIFVDDSTLSGEFDVAYGKSTQLKEYVEIMKQITNSKSVLNYGAVKYPENGYTNLIVNIDKLTQLTNWKPIMTFNEGIKEIVNDYLKDV